MTAAAAAGLRRLPARGAACGRCRRPIVWAVTLAGPNGRGGKAMPLDPVEAADGNTAVRVGHGGRLLARVLGKDETRDEFVEYLAMPHFATCPGSPTEPARRLPADVADLTAHRARRREHEST